jgi:hypothetical protein
LRRVFEGVVATCIAAGLVGGEAFSIDASLIKADVNKKKRVSGDQPIAWPKSEEASHAVREYLAALDAARSEDGSDWGGDGGGSNGGDRGGKLPKQVSLTDPHAAWVTRKGIDPMFAYDANYLIDNKVGIILDAEGTRANRKEAIAITQTMVDRVERRFDLRRCWTSASSACHWGSFLMSSSPTKRQSSSAGRREVLPVGGWVSRWGMGPPRLPEHLDRRLVLARDRALIQTKNRPAASASMFNCRFNFRAASAKD